MIDGLKSVLIWITIAFLVIIWLPLLAFRRLIDTDPACYSTGRLFRLLGKTISRINPNWDITISGNTDINDRNPYVMVCNHLSQADIPLISNLPWEMKWVAKKELFNVPVSGWMMRLAGDICVDRKAVMRKRSTLKQGTGYLQKNCSVIFFPEGTRSRSGKLNKFTIGAFELAIKNQVPILPLVIDGTQECLPKKSWKFGIAKDIRLKVLEPVDTKSLSEDDIAELRDNVRSAILAQLSEWRGVPKSEIDYMAKS